MSTANSVKSELKRHIKPEKAATLSSFFKTGKGQYGEGDKFIGVVVPDQRKVAKENKNLPLSEIIPLLRSEIHEHRLTALLILTYKFPKASETEQKSIIDLYLKEIKYINNWDLVDQSAPRILGQYFRVRPKLDRKILYTFARSQNLWKKRIAIISTYTFIRNKDFKDALKISEILLQDSHDLIHKAAGWMLREIGKIDMKTEEKFLQKHAANMPRTTLRYAIEKFPEQKRQGYLKLKI